MPNRRFWTAALTSGSGLVAKLVGGMLAVFLVASQLPKTEFGAFVVALTGAQMVSGILAAGFDRTALYKVSRALGTTGSQTLPGGDVAGVLLLLAVLAGVLGGGVFAWVSYMVLPAYGRGDLAEWGIWFSVLVFAAPPRMALTATLRGRQKITSYTIVELVIPNLLRLGLLLLVFHEHPSQLNAWISVAYVVPAVVPILAAFRLVSPNIGSGWSVLNSGDLRYGLTFAVSKLVMEPARSVDVLIVGASLAATTAADYGIASRIASILTLPKQAVETLLVPRIGAAHSSGDTLQLLGEYGVARDVSSAAALLGLALLGSVGGIALSLVGDYESALPLVLALCLAAYVRIAFGASGNLLAMVGRPGLNLFCTVLGLVVLLAGSAVVVRDLGAMGVAYSVSVSAVVANVSQAVLVWKMEQLLVVRLGTIVVLCAAFTLVTLQVFEAAPTVFVTAGLTLLAFYQMLSAYRSTVKP